MIDAARILAKLASLLFGGIAFLCAFTLATHLNAPLAPKLAMYAGMFFLTATFLLRAYHWLPGEPPAGLAGRILRALD